MALKSKVSPIIFIVTTVCFLFPFVTVSCNGQKVATFSGVQLATGTTLEQQQMFGPPQKKHVDAEPLATVAAICALAGVGLSFLGIKAALAPAISGGAGALFLLLLQSKLNTDITQQGQGMFRLEFEAGYALALASFILATAWNTFVFLQSRKPSTVASPPPPPLAAAAAGAAAIAGTSSACPDCGQALSAGARFCGRCGKARGVTSTSDVRDAAGYPGDMVVGSYSQFCLPSFYRSLNMRSINSAISIPVIVALIFSVAGWSKNFAGVYVRDNKRDYIELRSDGTFFLREHGLGLARKNESAARSTVRLLNTAELTYQTVYPSQGYAASLTVLGPGAPPIDCKNAANVNADHSCLVDGVLGCATAWCVKGGYRYTIVSSFKAPPLADYTVTATPVDINMGSKNFCANADNVIRERIGPPLSNPITYTECGTWSPFS